MLRPILEHVVDSADAASAAERSGATRLELCIELDEGGTTPPESLIHAVVAAASIPVFVMIRPRAGNFVYRDDEIAVMRGQIGAAIRAGAGGIVLGVLTADRRIDLKVTRGLVDAADGRPVTFHRAFDDASDLPRALDAAIAAGATRVLTSGAADTALAGANRIADLVQRGGDRITIVAAGRIRAGNVAEVIARTGVREVHARFESAAATRQLVDLL